MKLSASDFFPIRSCKLLWRWNSRSHRLFSAEDLARIRPLTPDKAAEAQHWAMQYTLRNQLSPDRLRNLVRTPATDSDAATAWLLDLVPPNPDSVVLSWDETTSVLTDWMFFARNWDDFCYPSSDDVFVFPLTQDWLLFYAHYEVFEFGRLAV